MRRKLKLSVSLCRLIDSRSWLSAVRQVSQLKGVVVLDVKVPKRKDNGIGQAEDTKDDTSCDWCCVEFGP